jgi:hypothetical protein
LSTKDEIIKFRIFIDQHQGLQEIIRMDRIYLCLEYFNFILLEVFQKEKFELMVMYIHLNKLILMQIMLYILKIRLFVLHNIDL